MMAADDAEQQEEELSTLEAIYGDGFERLEGRACKVGVDSAVGRGARMQRNARPLPVPDLPLACGARTRARTPADLLARSPRGTLHGDDGPYAPSISKQRSPVPGGEGWGGGGG